MNIKNPDILNGAEEIAAWLGDTPQHIRVLVKNGTLPVFRSGRLIRARKSTLTDWMATQESKAFPESENALFDADAA